MGPEPDRDRTNPVLRIDGRTLSVRTAPLDHPSFPGQEVIGYVDWERKRSACDRRENRPLLVGDCPYPRPPLLGSAIQGVAHGH